MKTPWKTAIKVFAAGKYLTSYFKISILGEVCWLSMDGHQLLVEVFM